MGQFTKCDDSKGYIVIYVNTVFERTQITMGKVEQVNDNFDEKFELYANMLYRLGFVYLKNYADAEDAVQNAFIKLFCNSYRFKTQLDEQRWLIRITINICKDYLKRPHNRKNTSLDHAENVCDEQSFIDLDLARLFDSLTEKYKSVIYLHYIEGFSIEEISGILTIGQSAVKMRLKRGREYLKTKLEEGQE